MLFYVARGNLKKLCGGVGSLNAIQYLAKQVKHSQGENLKKINNFISELVSYNILAFN